MGKSWGDRGVVGKMAISLKRVKIDEKLLRRAYRNSPTLFQSVPSPTPYGLHFPKIGGLQPQPKTAIAIISGTGIDTECKFGRYIQSVHPNKSPWKIWEKGSVGVSRDCSFFEYHLLSQERVKLRISNLAGTFTGSIRTKAHEKGKGSVGVSRVCSFFSTRYYLRNG